MSDNKTSIDQAFEEVEAVFGQNRVIRHEQIQNLREAANNPEMKISPFDKAMVIQSKLMIIKTLDDLLKSDEEVSLKKLKMKLARKDSETNGMVGQTIVALLKNIRATGENNDTKGSVDHGEAMADFLLNRKITRILRLHLVNFKNVEQRPRLMGRNLQLKRKKNQQTKNKTKVSLVLSEHQAAFESVF